MGRYSADIKSAKASIKRDGQLVIWRKSETVPIDPAKPWLGDTATESDYPVYIAFVPKRLSLAEALREMRGSVTKTGTVSGLMGAVPFVPDSSDIVIRDGETLQIGAIDKLNVNGQIILFTIDFKG